MKIRLRYGRQSISVVQLTIYQIKVLSLHYKKDFISCQLRNLPYLIGGRCRVIVAVFRVTGTCHILLWGTRIHSKQIIMLPLNKKTSNNYIFSLSNVACKVPAELFIFVKVELYLSYVVLRYLRKEHPGSLPTCSFVAQYYSYNILLQISCIFPLFRIPVLAIAIFAIERYEHLKSLPNIYSMISFLTT